MRYGRSTPQLLSEYEMLVIEIVNMHVQLHWEYSEHESNKSRSTKHE